MPDTLYRLSWETVAQSALRLYCNADPMLFKNVTQTVPNSEIPDEHWQPVSRETTDPWQQFNTLRAWADADKEFVRNVSLERQSNELICAPVDPAAESVGESESSDE